MTSDVKRVLVPRLRFPEFEGSGEWEEKKLGSIGEFTGGGTPSKEKGEYWGGDNPWISSSDISDESIYEIRINRFITGTAIAESATKLVPANSILIVSRVGVGKLAVSKISIYTSQDFTNYTPDKDDSVFLAYELKSLKNALLSFNQGMAIKGFTKEDISALVILVPSLPEQTHIAACLSSLDTLIAAQGQRLEALQEHKRGLMQGLFPAEGENVPRLRFPEFAGAEAWEEKKLGEVGDLISGLTYSPDDVRDSGLLVLRSSNIKDSKIDLQDNVFVRNDINGANLTQPNDILVCVRNGSSSLIGKNALISNDMPLCTHGAFMTIFRSKMANFMFQLFQTEIYQSQVKSHLGATINSINGSQFVKYRFHIPSIPEQTRIAACLSSLDTLIAAQRDRISELKTFKRGLMQGLFPAPDAGAQ